MKRREFIAGLGAAGAFPFTANGQPPATMARIAYLGALSPAIADPRLIDQFKVGLVENGLIEGQNITVEYYWGEGNADRLRQLASELSHRKLDVIVTAGTPPVLALREAKVTAPIVFAILGDPIGIGVIQSLARPEGNITGLSMANVDLESKRLEILKDTVPALRKVMLLHDPSNGTTDLLDTARSGARRLGLELRVVDTVDPNKIAEAFSEAAAQSVGGIATMASPFFNFQRKQLIALALQHRLASIWEDGVYVRDGGFLAYGPSFPDMYRRSAGYVSKILKGAKPSDLPVEQPTKFELVINLKTAKALGLTVSSSLLARADEVIE